LIALRPSDRALYPSGNHARVGFIVSRSRALLARAGFSLAADAAGSSSRFQRPSRARKLTAATNAIPT